MLRIVYTSSIAAVGFCRTPDEVRTADDWNEDAANPYLIAKVRGEREAIRLADETSIETIRLCPAIVLGPYDYRITPSTQSMALDLINRKGVTYVGGTNLVHVKDVGEVHAKAVSQGQPGGRYVISGANLDLLEVGALVEKWSGVKPRHLGVGRNVAVAFGAALDAVSKITGKPPQFSRSIAEDQSYRWGYFDCTDTYKTFGYEPTGADEAMRDAVAWLRQLGKI